MYYLKSFIEYDCICCQLLIYYKKDIKRKGRVIIFGFDLSYPLIWLILAVIFAIIEAATLGLTTIWFAAGALLAMIVAALDFSVTIQILIFLISSAVLIYFTRPFAIKLLKVGNVKTNSASLIGEIGIVKEPIHPFETGLVKVSGQIWTAKSKDKESIDKNKKVRILSIEGVKLIVEELEEA